MIRRIPAPVAVFAAALALSLALAGAAWAYHTNFTGAYCNYGCARRTPATSRVTAR